MAKKLEVQIKLRDLITGEINRVKRDFRLLGTQVTRASTQLGNFRRSMLNLKSMLAVGGITLLGKKVLETGMDFQSMTNTLDAAIGKFTFTEEEMKYVRSEADRMGLSFEKTTEAYAKFAAASTRSGMSLEQTREVFRSFSETAVSMGIDANSTRLIFLALEQMISKGKVSMEELRRQLGEKLPGAFQLAAKSMGLTTQEFEKLVSNGKVTAQQLLPNFAKLVRQELGGSFDKASTQIRANTQRMMNAWFDLKVAASRSLIPIANEVIPVLQGELKKFTDYIDSNKDKIIDSFKGIGDKVQKVFDTARKFAKLVWEKRNIIGMLILVKPTMEAVKAFIALSGALNTAITVMKTHPIIAMATAIATLYAATEALNERAKSKALERYTKDLENFTSKGNPVEILTAEINTLQETIAKTEKASFKWATSGQAGGGGFRQQAQVLDILKEKLQIAIDMKSKFFHKTKPPVIPGSTKEKTEYEPIPETDTDTEPSDQELKLAARKRKQALDYQYLLITQHFKRVQKYIGQTRKAQKALDEARMNDMAEGVDKELLQNKIKYDKLRQMAGDNAIALKRIAQAEQIEENRIRREGGREALSIATQSAAALYGLSDKYKGLYKALAMFEAALDAQKAASAAYAGTLRFLMPIIGPAAFPVAGAAAGTAYAAGAARMAQIADIKFANGVDGFVTSGPTIMMVGDNPGGREKVSVTPMSSPNVSGPKESSDRSMTLVLNNYDYSGQLAETFRRQINDNKADRTVRDLFKRAERVVR